MPTLSDAPGGASLPPAVRHHVTPEADIITWRSTDIVSRRSMIPVFVFWAVWIGVFGFVILGHIQKEGVHAMRHAILIWAAGSVLIPFLAALSMMRRVTLQISDEAFVLLKSRALFVRKVRIPKERAIALAFEPVNVTEYDPCLHLNLRYKSRWRFLGEDYVVLAPWMDEEAEYALFLLLKEIFQARGWDITYSLKLHR